VIDNNVYTVYNIDSGKNKRQPSNPIVDIYYCNLFQSDWNWKCEYYYLTSNKQLVDENNKVIASDILGSCYTLPKIKSEKSGGVN
jgi:hypothetical protein